MSSNVRSLSALREGGPPVMITGAVALTLHDHLVIVVMGARRGNAVVTVVPDGCCAKAPAVRIHVREHARCADQEWHLFREAVAVRVDGTPVDHVVVHWNGTGETVPVLQAGPPLTRERLAYLEPLRGDAGGGVAPYGLLESIRFSVFAHRDSEK